MHATGDVAARLAERLESSAPSVHFTAEDLWPACSVLADAGLLVTAEEHLGAQQVGPFRLAHTRYRDAVSDFLDLVVPSLVGGWATATPGAGALAGAAAFACKVFVELDRGRVVFGTSRSALIRWTVLIELDVSHRSGVEPPRLP